MLTKNRTFTYLLMAIFFSTGVAWAENKKIMSTRIARELAVRAVVESICGLKIESPEEVIDIVVASFKGKTESKTSAEIQGIKIEEVVYDSKKDIAQVTASIRLDEITKLDGKILDLKGKTLKRVAFATSTPANAGPIRALRAAELDGYKNLVKTVVGFTLESQTTVEDYILTSDSVKKQVLATIYLADMIDYGWGDEGNAFVKLRVNVKDVGEILGSTISGVDEVVEVEGKGSCPLFNGT